MPTVCPHYTLNVRQHVQPETLDVSFTWDLPYAQAYSNAPSDNWTLWSCVRGESIYLFEIFLSFQSIRGTTDTPLRKHAEPPLHISSP
jgi:hypothetical protein